MCPVSGEQGWPSSSDLKVELREDGDAGDCKSQHAIEERFGGARVWEVFHSARARPWDIGEWNSEEG